MNEKFLKEHSEKVKKALLTAPKLSLEEKMRRADLQMGRTPKKKSSEEENPPKQK